jgi:hypothetical protein
MPFFGLELLDMARDVAAFDLPARVGQLSGTICSSNSFSPPEFPVHPDLARRLSRLRCE